jgi:hypothetical protein
MSDTLYIRVSNGHPNEEGDWIRADVILNGAPVATGFAPISGVYKQEGITIKSAIALAQSEFSRQLTDVRYEGVIPNSC